ncbi:hypothetical protein HanIR_Chr12g0561351 [Helianthus annuus]|nr:hypothetical protein HanIR_Chr12g0561351 [Helianthus annuus]
MIPVRIDGCLEILKSPMTLNSFCHITIIGINKNITLKGDNIIQTSQHVLVVPKRLQFSLG